MKWSRSGRSRIVAAYGKVAILIQMRSKTIMSAGAGMRQTAIQTKPKAGVI
jgi:hypothetical protein